LARVLSCKFTIEPSSKYSHEDCLDNSESNEHGIPYDIFEIATEQGAKGSREGHFYNSFLDYFVTDVFHFLFDDGLDLFIVGLEVLRVSLLVGFGLVMHDGHEVVGWVAELRTGEVEIASEVGSCIVYRALVDHPAFDQEDKVVEEVEDISIGLMDCHEDGFILTHSQLFQVSNNDKGS
jgi:hypothetical protein